LRWHARGTSIALNQFDFEVTGVASQVEQGVARIATTRKPMAATENAIECPRSHTSIMQWSTRGAANVTPLAALASRVMREKTRWSRRRVT
jgi:hypothetical protein